MKPLNIIILGRAGSGKTTQAKLLAKEFGLKFISSGDLLRALAKKHTFVGRKVKQILKRAELFPGWLALWLWVSELMELEPSQGIVLDGASRRLEEAKLLGRVFKWSERPNLKILLIDISRKEAFRRLVKRGRKDDTPDLINKRLDWFYKDVVPVIKYYKNAGRLIRINGQRSIKEVFKEIICQVKSR